MLNIMNELVKKSVILTRRYTRYGGDSESILALVLDHDGVLSLYSDSDNDSGNTQRLIGITTSPEYISWLFDNAMDLMMMIESSYPYYWYNDRNVDFGRKKEFRSKLNTL